MHTYFSCFFSGGGVAGLHYLLKFQGPEGVPPGYTADGSKNYSVTETERNEI